MPDSRIQRMRLLQIDGKPAISEAQLKAAEALAKAASFTAVSAVCHNGPKIPAATT